MKTRSLLMMLLLAIFVGSTAKAQVAVTAGSKVTSETDLVSGKGYLIKYTSMTGTPYIYDAGTTTPLQAPSTQNSPTTACVFYFISDGNGAYKLENAYTGNYWPAASGNARLYPTSEANAGSWAISISSGTATMTCTNGGTTYGLDRLTPDVVGWSSRKTVEIYEVTAPDLSTAAQSSFTGYDINVGSTEAASISVGQWYVMKNRGRNVYAYENSGSMKNQSAAPSGSATDNAKFLVRFLNAGDGKYYLQNGLSNYWGAIPQNTPVPATALGTEKYTAGKINNTDGHFYFTSETNNIVLDCQDPGYPVVGWGTTIPSSTGGNNDWAFYPVELVESWVPTTSEVYTISHADRGSLMYAPSQSTKYVWSSGKNSQTFSATDPNCQWVIIPTGTSSQFYLFNVGAGKFAIPSGSASKASWVFSPNAVAVEFITQSDGTKKIKTAATNTYAAISNGYAGPIINYNDAGGNFTVTKVDGEASTAATAAVNKLVKNASTALTSYPKTSGWYALQIKSASSNTASVGRYVYEASSLYNDLYPLTFTGSIDVQPSVSDPTFFTHLDCRDWNDNDWQLPDGRYLVENSNKFPTVSNEKSSIIAGYDGGNYFKSSNNRFADPYTSNGNYFIGETTSFRTTWNVYPIDLAAAGLTAWQMICDAAPGSQQISCSRSDVCGLTSVYKNGYIFLPSSVTPANTEFSLPGATEVTVDANAKTVSFTYDPNLAIVDGGVTASQGYQVTGRGNEKAVLLRITAAPFKEMTNTSLSLSLDETTVNNISALTLYEATSNGVEFMAMGDLTQAATTTTIGTSTSLNLGTVAAGTHYYWLCATVKSDATLGAILDAAVSGITYTCNSNVTTLPLNLNPSTRGLMVFDKEQTLFIPTTGGSNYYRIPALITADNGSLIAACDKRYNSSSDLGNHKIDVVLRRSTDGGKTWSDAVTVAEGDGSSDAAYGYGDPAFVKCASGKLICLMAAGKTGFWSGMSNIAMITSDYDGENWSSPIDITTNTGHFTNNSSKSDWFVTSGKGLCTHDGVVMFLLDADHSSETNLVLYSVDEGENWIIDDAVVATGANEGKLVELSDGNLLSSTRNGGNRIFNTGTYTKNANDCDFTWGTQTTNSTLNQGGSGNNQDIIVYERNADNSAKILLHTLTVGNGHKNLKLFISIDEGSTWTEMMQIQPEGSRYAVMTILDNGDVGILYEDYGLNAGKEYPITFLTVTKEQIEAFYKVLEEEIVNPLVKNSVQGSATGANSYGSFSDTSNNWAKTWTSNASSGKAGLTISTGGYVFNHANVYDQRCFAMRPSSAGATDVITITAPAGYYIDSYTITGRNYSGSQTYQLYVDENAKTTTSTSGATFTVNNVNAPSTSFNFYGSSTSNYLCVTNFTIQLRSKYPVNFNAVNGKSYATLYLPFDVQTDADTKAFYASTADNGKLTLVDLNGNIPAQTAVVLINSNAATNATFNVATGLSSVVNEADNLLKGTLVDMTLDLGDTTPYYSLGMNEGKVGFYKFNNSGTTTITLGANKAYLEVSGSLTPSKGFVFGFEETSSLDNLTIDNLTIGEEGIYDLLGRKVMSTLPDSQTPSLLRKGIYIVNGKKVVIK